MATALESASLVMAPCGYEDGTLGSLQPTDGSGDFTFTRGSNLSATRVNAAGNIEKGYENLLLQSNSFDTTWVTAATSVTSNQAGYDGFNDAWKLETTSNGSRYLQQLISINSVQSISIYAKSGTTDFLGIQIIGTGSGYSFFNLSNGTLGSSSPGVIDKNIELVNGTTDWYKCSFVINANTVAIRIYPTNADSVFPSTTGQNIYIQDAMLNQGLVAYPYIETTTTSAQGGILEDTPRIDYLSGPNGSLLLEPSRSNLVTNSEYITLSSGLSTIEYNGGISPEGVSNSIRVVENTSTSFHTLNSSAPISNTNAHTLSVFVKTDGVRDTIKLRSGVSTDIYTSLGFTLSGSGSYAGSDGGIESYGNGWYRIYWTFSHTQTGTSTLFLNGNYYVGTGQEWFFYGLQLEQNATYPTSLIPTYGTSVTRASDGSLSNSNFSSIFGSSLLTQYTIYLDILKAYNNGSSVVFIPKGSQNQGIIILFSGDRLYYFSSATGYTTPVTITDGNTHKYILSANNGTIKVFFDGVLINTITNPSDALANIDIEGVKHLDISQYLVFPTALSDAECIELTTI